MVDTSSALLGLGHTASRSSLVRPWTPSTHVSPWEYSARWEDAVNRPRATRNPALGAEYALDITYGDAMVDTRSPTELIGVPTRSGARVVCRASNGVPPQK